VTRARLAETLRREVKGPVGTDVPLAPLTTYRLGGPAAALVEPRDADDVGAIGRVLREEDPPVPVLVLGRGSNTLVSDEGWPGLVLRLGSSFSWVLPAEGGLASGAATSLPVVANWAARRGLSGVEFFVAVPGSVGGAIRMNAGAHGGDVAATLRKATIFDLDRLDMTERDAASLNFGYRSSALTDRQVVIDGTFTLESVEASSVKAKMDELRRTRAATQPPAVQNAGSTFKNPPGDHAGRLVEAAGLKGFRIGGVRVSEKHANFFVAEEGASAQDVFDLVAEVRRRVRDMHGVELEPEVRFAGRFHASEVPS